MSQEAQEILAREWVKSQRLLTGYLHAALGDFQKSEEVAQRIAVVAVRRAADYDPQRPFVPWLLGIAKLELLKFSRDQARDRHQFTPDLLDRLTANYVEAAPQLKSMEQALRECLKQVPDRARQVLDMRYNQAMHTLEIARQARTTDAAIRALLKRTRHMLKRCIQSSLGWESTQ
ncbi:MAG: sigma-70 family RNA polymerase sigma factor [Planctomycetes bacterium]|nr:sigma-70 family RNA polymerase sigma factor [Planctomycetota bacterium]